MLAIWSLVPLTILKEAITSGNSWFTYCWSLAWRILRINFLACEMTAIVWYFGHSLALPFFGIGMKTDLFQSCDHGWVFQIYWHIECSTFTASYFRIWNSSTEIPSPPLALFIVMLSKAHLTSLSRMSGFRWVTTASCLSWSWRSFFYSSVYSCHLFLITSAFVRSIPFLSFIEPIFAWNIPLVSLIFSKRSLVFPILLFSSISLHWLLRKAFLFLAILWNSAFRCLYLSFYASLLFTAICKASPDSHFAFLHVFSMGMVLITVSCIPPPPPRTAIYQISFPFQSLWILSRVSLWYTIGSTYIYFMQSSVCMSNSVTKFFSPHCLSLSIHLFFICGSLFLLCKLIHLYHFAGLHM